MFIHDWKTKKILIHAFSNCNNVKWKAKKPHPVVKSIFYDINRYTRCVSIFSFFYSPLSWGNRIDWLQRFSQLRPPSPNEFLGYDIKQSDSEGTALEFWRMRISPSLPLLPGPFWPRVVAPDSVLSMGEIELFDYLKLSVKKLMFNWIVCDTYQYLEPFNWIQKKRAQGRLKCYQQNLFTNHIYLIYMYKQDLELNNL